MAWIGCQKSDILPTMKTLRLTKPHVVIMVGLPGAGKSFFADHFAQTFSAPIVSWNAIRDELFNEPNFSKDEDAVVSRVADHLFTQLLRTNATIVLEGDTLTQVSRQTLAKTVHSVGYEPLFVWVQTDAATTKARAAKQGIPAEVIESARKRFTPLKESDPYVVISGKHTYASQLKIVLRKLSGERAAAASQPIRSSDDKVVVGRRVSIQ